MSRKQNPLLNRIDQLTAEKRWAKQIGVIDEAMAQGHALSIHRVPLSFLREEAMQQRAEEATAQAAEILVTAERSLAQGDVNLAQQQLAEALAIEHLPPDAAQRVQACVERLETQLRNYASSAYNIQDRPAAVHLESLLTDLHDSRPTMYRMLALCAVPRWLDADVVQILRQKDDGRDQEVLGRINVYSFVYPWETDRYTVSEDARRHFLKEWQEEPEAYQRVNARLADHFARRLETDFARNPATKERFRQAQLYHTFLAEPVAGVQLLGKFFQEAEDAHQLVAARQYVIVLQELRGQISPEYFTYVDYAEGWYHHLRGNNNAAAFIFSELAQRADLPADLCARTERGMAAVQVEQGNWLEALDGFDTALQRFTELDAMDEAAETMAQLGRAYLEISADAMGEYDPIMPEYTGQSGALALGALLVRLPLILYLIGKLGIFWPLPNLLRLGQGLDWVIARLFSDAILWLRQAECTYADLGDRKGVNRASEALGRIYWMLNDPQRAMEFLEPLIDEYPAGSYARASVDQELAENHLSLGNTGAAQSLLDESLPIFQRVGHQARVAECHNRLGAISEVHDAPDDAARHYSEALCAWQSIGNDVRVTQMVHRLERLEAESKLSGEIAQAAASARQGVDRQIYATRYIHPFSLLYQRTSIIAFAVLTGLLSLISVQLRPTINLVSKLTLDASQLEHMNYALDQSVLLAAELTVEPHPRVILIFSALAFVLFLFLYASAGSYLLRRIPLQSVQESFTDRVEIDSRAIQRIAGPRSTTIAWAKLEQTVYSTRRFCQSPIDLFSAIALAGERSSIEIDGLVQGYENVEQTIRTRRGENVGTETDISVSFLCRGWGIVFVGAIVLQIVFSIAAVVGQRWLSQTIPMIHYTYADLWNIVELGIALPLLYWLVIQPARYRLYARKAYWNLGILWAVSLTALLFSISTIQIGRPAILASAISIFIGAFVLMDIWRVERIGLPRPEGDRSASRPFEIALILGTIAIMGASIFVLYIELRSFHFQAIGYEQFTRSQHEVEVSGAVINQQIAAVQLRILTEKANLYKLQNEPEAWIQETSKTSGIRTEDARELLPEEIRRVEEQLDLAQSELAGRQGDLDEIMAGFSRVSAAFQRSIDIKRDAVPYRFLIVTLAYLKEYEQAIDKFEEMEMHGLVRPKLDSALLTQVLHQGGLYLSNDADGQAEAWTLANEHYVLLLSDSDLQPSKIMESNHLYAALLVSMAGAGGAGAEAMLDAAEKILTERKDFLEGRNSIDVTILAEIYAELGTVHLRRGFDSEADNPVRSAYLKDAQSAFQQSIDQDPSLFAAYNGLAWALFEQSRIIPGSCIAGFDDPDVADEYILLIEDAVDAFDGALAIPTPDGVTAGVEDRRMKTRASYHRTRGQLHYILGHCDDDAQGYDRSAYLRLAIDDYVTATRLDERVEWYVRLGDIRLEYANLLKREGKSVAATLQQRQVARNYAKAIAMGQGYYATRKKLHDMYHDDLEVSDPAAETVAAIASAARRTDDADFYLKFAQEEYERGLAQLAAVAISQTLALDPNNRDAILLAGPIYEEWARPGNDQEREARYSQAVEVVESALQIDDRDSNLWLTRGRAHLGLKQIEQALADLEQARTLAPRDPNILYALGLAHGLNGEGDLAAALYAKANQLSMTMDPEAAKPIYSRAITDLLITTGDDLQSSTALAIEVAESALSHRGHGGNDVGILTDIAAKANNDGDYDGAIPVWTKVIFLSPQSNRNWRQMRSALILSPNFGQVQSGDIVLTLLMGLFEGDDVEVLHEIAQMDLDDNVFGLAAAALERALELDPQYTQTYAKLTETYARWGRRWKIDHRLEQAVDVMDLAIEAGIEHAQVYHHAGLALRDLRRWDEAIAAERRAIALDPAFREAYSRLGWTAYLAGEFDISVEASQGAIALDRGDPREHFNLGLAFMAVGDANGASAAYDAGIAAANDPGFADRRTARLNEGLGDLRTNSADPASLAAGLIERMETALSDQR